MRITANHAARRRSAGIIAGAVAGAALTLAAFVPGAADGRGSGEAGAGAPAYGAGGAPQRSPPEAPSGRQPPVHPFLVDSPFPAVHMNLYRQASTPLRGPEARDELGVRFTPTPENRPSPWLLSSAKYPDGSRVVWGGTSTHVFKAMVKPGEFRVVADCRIDRNPLDMSWTLLFLDEHTLLTRDQGRILAYGEADPRDPRSAIVPKGTYTVPDEFGGEASRLAVTYDGQIVFANKANFIGILGRDFKRLVTYRIPVEPGEVTYHNDLALDETGRIYCVTTRKMVCVRWDARSRTLRPEWSTPMDFGGRPNQGSGTTPTLMGVGADQDRLVLVVDSKTPANMVAFWRDAIPEGWKGLPGLPRRVAAVTPLPGVRPPSPIYTAVENSPTCWGYSIACAQYNGFLGQPGRTLKGAFKLTWDPQRDRLNLDWANRDVNLNNVLTYSAGSNLVYGSGREADGAYYYYGLDWDTGRVAVRRRLGEGAQFDDPGCANLILEDRSVLFCSRRGLVQVGPSSVVDPSAAGAGTDIPSGRRRRLRNFARP